MTVKTALLQGTSLLDEGAVPVPRLTAEVLLCHALQRERSYLYSHPEAELSEVSWLHYGRYLHERLQGKPTQYITKQQEFYGRGFRVTPDVLIPRPETEHLVEAALPLARTLSRIVDVGCGSGAIAVTLSLESASKVLGTDISEAALKVAARNAQQLSANVQLVACDLMSALDSASMDMIVSNPPYVPQTEQPSLQREVRDWEPGVALFGGPTGLELYRRIIDDATRVLRPRGWLLLELGFKSSDAVRAMLDTAWSDIEIFPDLAGIPRVLRARR